MRATMTSPPNHPISYLDHAATTPIDPAVLQAMLPYLSKQYGNPSSIYQLGRAARQAIEDSRESIASSIGCRPTEVVFTGSGTEADNLAIKGMAWARSERGKHIITSSIEHHAVLHACQSLKKRGFEVTYLPVDQYGMVDVASVHAAIRRDTILISVMHANNEIGTLQPIEEIGAIAREHDVPFHTDAVQTFGQIPTKVNDMGCSLMSLSAHKIYGPKGVGALYVRRGCRLSPLLDGGGQEKNRRSGTENVAGIVGFGTAATLACERMNANEAQRILLLRTKLAQGLEANIPDLRLNGHPEKRLPNNLNYSVRFLEGEAMLLGLDLRGICASSGSACTSGSLEPSHVLAATRVSREWARGTVRFSLGKDNTEADIASVVEVFPPIISELRSLQTRGRKRDDREIVAW